MNTARFLLQVGTGTQTAGLAFAGGYITCSYTGITGATEEYDGSSWTTSGPV
jgi:hypothetical protein